MPEPLVPGQRAALRVLLALCYHEPRLLAPVPGQRWALGHMQEHVDRAHPVTVCATAPRPGTLMWAVQEAARRGWMPQVPVLLAVLGCLAAWRDVETSVPEALEEWKQGPAGLTLKDLAMTAATLRQAKGLQAKGLR